MARSSEPLGRTSFSTTGEASERQPRWPSHQCSVGVLVEQPQRVGQHVDDGFEALDAALRRAGGVEHDGVTGDAGDAPREPPERADQAHRLGQAGRVALDDGPGALGRQVARREAGAAGRDDEAGEAVGQLAERRGDAAGAVLDDAVIDDRRSPRPGAARRGRRRSGPPGCRGRRRRTR